MTDSKFLNLEIRREKINEKEAVFQLVKRAFRGMPFSDHKEHFLVDRLRESKSFIPELSIVAAEGEKVIGYVLLTHADIRSKDNMEATLALAPIAVHPECQNNGIGRKMINYAHKKALGLGYGSVVLVGHQEYYPKLGYELASKYGISFPFDVPEINSFVIQLKEGALKKVKGEIVYAEEFFEV